VLSGILEEADDLRSNPRDLQDVLATEDWARSRAREIVARATSRAATAGVPTGGAAATSKVGASR
jgi:hypothetical protein